MPINNHSFICSFICSFTHSTNLQLYGNLTRWDMYPVEALSLVVTALYPFSLLTSALAGRRGQAKPQRLLENHADPQLIPSQVPKGWALHSCLLLSIYPGLFRKPFSCRSQIFITGPRMPVRHSNYPLCGWLIVMTASTLL